MRQARPLQLGARVGQHRGTEVQADAAAEARREQLQHPAGAGADVDQQIERARAQRRRHGRLHVCFRHVQRANLVPVGSIRLEVDLCRFLPLGLQGFRPPAVAHQHRIGLIDALQKLARNLAAAPFLGQPEVNPASFRRPLDQGRPPRAASDAG